MTLGLVSFLSIFIPALFGIFYFNKTESQFRYFTCFLLIMVLVECIGNYLFYNHKSNLHIFSLSLLIETITLLLLINYTLNGRALKLIVRLIALLYVGYFLYRLYYAGFSVQFDSEMRIISCILLIFASGLSIIQQSTNMKVHILYNPVFIFSFTLLLYYAATLFVHGALHIILQKSIQLVAKPIWKAHSAVNILTNFLFAFAIWLSYRQRKLSL